MTQDLHPFPHGIPPCKWPSARDVVRPKVPSCQGPRLTTVPFYRCSSMGPAGLSKQHLQQNQWQHFLHMIIMDEINDDVMPDTYMILIMDDDDDNA